MNKNGKVLEYTLFQPGLFLDYLAYPHKTAKYVTPLQTVFDFENCRALIVDGHEDAVMTFTSAKDLAGIVAQAVDYDGEWPRVWGIQGNKTTPAQLLEIGARVRGTFKAPSPCLSGCRDFDTFRPALHRRKGQARGPGGWEA